ncbi:MAG: glycosyltransferase family 2 protein [Gemmatimonadota bacterium]
MSPIQRPASVPDPKDVSPSRPTVSAVAFNFNGDERILSTVAALRRQSHPIEAIVVVDNASTDGSPEAIRERFPDVQVVDLGENLGISTARNRGLATVSSDLAFMVDGDVYADDDCLAEMVQAWLRNGKPAVICPRVVLIPEEDTVQADGAGIHFTGAMILRHAYQPVASVSHEETVVGGCIGACYLMDRRVAINAGGFDETFFHYHEDLEFCVRMRAYGHTFLFTPAIVRHDRGEGTVGLSFRGHEGAYPRRRAYYSIRHHALLLLIHYRFRTLFLLSPVLLLYEAASLGAGLFGGFGREWFRAWWWIVTNPATIREKRGRIQARRVARDRDLLEGGPIPLAPGFLRSGLASLAAATVSGASRLWWSLVRPLIG